MTDSLATDETRIDRWLCAVRLVKTRPLATQLCEGGHVLANGSPAKPSTKFALAIGLRPASGIASASSRSCGPSSRAWEPSSPRPVTWTTARRSCRRPGRTSCPRVGRADPASVCGASSSASAGLPTPEPDFRTANSSDVEAIGSFPGVRTTLFTHETTGCGGRLHRYPWGSWLARKDRTFDLRHIAGAGSRFEPGGHLSSEASLCVSI